MQSADHARAAVARTPAEPSDAPSCGGGQRGELIPRRVGGAGQIETHDDQRVALVEIDGTAGTLKLPERIVPDPGHIGDEGGCSTGDVSVLLVIGRLAIGQRQSELQCRPARTVGARGGRALQRGLDAGAGIGTKRGGRLLLGDQGAGLGRANSRGDRIHLGRVRCAADGRLSDGSRELR